MSRLSFQHGNEKISLDKGMIWAASQAGENYRDTAKESLWAIVDAVKQGTPWRDVVARSYAETHPWLHRIVTSPSRDLFFRQHPPAQAASVLDIGAGWGQIALPLARRSDLHVTVVEPTPERLAFIHAAAVEEQSVSRMHFVQADFCELEFEPQFDLAACIGVLEWVPKFRAGTPRSLQLDFLRRAHRLLKPGGQLVVGIENRLGLKYLLGARDDHLGVPNVGVFDAALATTKWAEATGGELRCFTFTRAELATLLAEAGFKHARFFAAFPDYKVPEAILPLENVNAFFEEGGFTAEHDGSNGQPLDIQSELKSHYRSLAQLRIAGEFAPSFYVVAETV